MKRLFVIILVILAAYVVYKRIPWGKDMSRVEKMRLNYEAEIESICGEFQLPASYFKALTILECSGEKPALTRFEPHVYEVLLDVKNGQRDRYGRFTTQQMELLSDDTIKKLATSWGPLQIMGYHCIPLDITFEQLSGNHAMRFAISWAEQTYGKYLREGDFENAFHIHNTGRPIPESGIPTTYDPNYIPNGIALIKMFENEN